MKDSHVVADVRRAAVDLFAAQGYANTSVQQIVEAAGVTKGAMYHYFASKDDLLFGIYDSLLSMQRSRLDDIVARGGLVEHVLRAACVDVVQTSIDHLPELTVFLRSMHMLSDDRRAEVTRRRREYHDTFAAVLERGQAEGLWRADIPSAVLVAHFFSAAHYLPEWFSIDGPEAPPLIAEQLTDLFVSALRRA